MRSKRNVIWLFLLMLITVNVVGQDEYMEHQGFGAKLGANYFNIDLRPAIGDISGEVSWSGGLVYVFSNKKNVGLQIEALLSSRKWKETIDDTLSAFTDLKFIEVPLITNIKFGSGRMKYILNLGTYIAFNVQKDMTIDLPESHVLYQSIVDRSERGSDFGLLIGGALRYISPIGIFQFDVRYVYGYQKIYNEDLTGFKSSNMSGVTAGLIYMINLKKEK